ncbi:cytochrome P450 [Streptomyces sp. NPDC058955]|uniref:cytochrome P450 n=1 Tax=unclassified Streptomyces TaxID=2593676 RepID=UPI00364EB331
MTVVRAPRGLPLVGNALSLARHRLAYLQSLRTRGPVVEVALGPRRLYVLNSPEAIRDVLAGGEEYDKGPMFENLAPFLGNGVLTCPNSEHRAQRRALQPAFRREAVSRYAAVVAGGAAEATAGFEDGQVIDVNRELRRVTVHVMCRILFASDDTAVREEVHRALPLLIRGVMRRTLMPWDRLNRIPTPAARRYDRAAAELRAAVRRAIARHRAAEDGTADGILAMLLALRDDDGRPLDEALVVDQVVTLLMAGSDSTAATMSWFFHALAGAPGVEKEIREELDEVLGGRLPGEADIPRMRRLTQALHETLRLYHPVWFLTRRSVTPVEVAGSRFPAGTDFVYSIASLHRDPHLFPDPLAFRPERWEGRAPVRGAWIPFGAGARKCVGDQLAMTEMTLILATILSRWSLYPVDGRPVSQVAMAVVHPDRLVMRLSRADHPSLRTSTPLAPEVAPNPRRWLAQNRRSSDR